MRPRSPCFAASISVRRKFDARFEFVAAASGEGWVVGGGGASDGGWVGGGAASGEGSISGAVQERSSMGGDVPSFSAVCIRSDGWVCAHLQSKENARSDRTQKISAEWKRGTRAIMTKAATAIPTIILGAGLVGMAVNFIGFERIRDDWSHAGIAVKAVLLMLSIALIILPILLLFRGSDDRKRAFAVMRKQAARTGAKASGAASSAVGAVSAVNAALTVQR